MEEWRNVPGTNGKYQINIDTKEGRCRSLNYRRLGVAKELKTTPNKYGRLYWRLDYGNERKCWQAARWIAMTYPELVQNEWFPGAEIDHIDTNPMNNHPSNLRWVTRKENLNNPITKRNFSKAFTGRECSDDTKGKRSKALKDKTGKWVIQLSPNNEILHFYRSSLQAERDTGIDQRNINACCRGKRSHAGPYIWKYA